MTTPRRGRKASITRKLTALVDELSGELDKMDDQLVRSLTAAELAEICRRAQEVFGEQRTAGFVALRDEGWSLGDLADEFGLTRARIAQVACRDRYKSGESRGGGSRRGRKT